MRPIAPVVRLLTACALAATAVGGCATAPPDRESAGTSSGGDTILLVSLDDGTIVRQTVDLGHEICMKSAENATTTCLSRGDPVFNQHGSLVGYEMYSDIIELHGVE